VQVFDLANNVSARARNYHTLDHDMEVIVVLCPSSCLCIIRELIND
jgi:hypothetical protein